MPDRRIVYEYPHFVPASADVRLWVSQAPTRFGVSVNTVRPGFLLDYGESLWLCMQIVELNNRSVEIRWLRYTTASTVPEHWQEVHERSDDVVWSGAMFQLDLKSPEDYCPHCLIKLEWAAMAERCPNCWWVK